MPKFHRILKKSLVAGSLFFTALSLVHMVGWKLPGLFIYFDVPSYAYQDRIIGFLAFCLAIFLLAGASIEESMVRITRYILVAGAGAIVGLVIINTQTDFADLNSGSGPVIYWLGTLPLIVYLLWILFVWKKAREEQG